MSLHNKPKYQIPELVESLKAHGLDANEPSQLSDAFRTGWVAGRAALAAQPGAVGEPYAYAVYFPDQQRGELVHDLDELLEDMTNETHEVTPLYAGAGFIASVLSSPSAAAPKEAKPAQAAVLTPAQRRELIDRAGDITDGLNQDDFADEIINQVIAAIKTGASNG